MSGNQVALVITCGGVVFSMMVAILTVLVKIASGWSATKHEISDLKDSMNALVDKQFNERLMRVEFNVEEIKNALRGPQGGGERGMASNQQRQRRR